MNPSRKLVLTGSVGILGEITMNVVSSLPKAVFDMEGWISLVFRTQKAVASRPGCGESLKEAISIPEISSRNRPVNLSERL